jgi:tetratricopeptide (TPR) repeat protein
VNFAQAAQKSRGMTFLKLLLEWMTLPALIIGLQLPQAVHCYWFASSAYALGQNQMLSTSFARKALGVDALAKMTREIVNSKSTYGGGEGYDAPVMSSETLRLVKAAAQARAENNNAMAINLLLRAVRGETLSISTTNSSASSVVEDKEPLRADDLGNAHPSVLFALGQTYAMLKEWKKSALTYEYSARPEPDSTQRSRALMGAGVARARIGDLNLASEALAEANRLNPSEVSIKIALASAVKLNGDAERALDILREAAALQPEINERYVKPLERELGQNQAAVK